MDEIAPPRQSLPLGRSGLMVSPLAWGMWRLRGSDVNAAQALVEAALAAGITLHDTADIYGPDNDEPFGAAETLLGRVFAQAPGLRAQVVLASKGGIRMGVPYDSSPAYIAQAIDASLRRLGIDQLDLWQIHRPDPLAHPAEVAAALDSAVASGKVRAVGVSNHSPAQTRALLAHLAVPLASTQPEYSPLQLAPLEDGTLDLAMEAGHGVLAWSPLAQGRLGEGDPRPGRAVATDLRTARVRAALAAQGERFGLDATAAAYSWILAHPARPIPILGTQNPARIAASVQALNIRWTRAQWFAVLIAARGEPLP